MAFIDIQLMAGIFDATQTQRLTSLINQAVEDMVGTEDCHTNWVRVQQVSRNDWVSGTDYIIDEPVKSLLSPYQVLMDRAVTER